MRGHYKQPTVFDPQDPITPEHGWVSPQTHPQAPWRTHVLHQEGGAEERAEHERSLLDPQHWSPKHSQELPLSNTRCGPELKKKKKKKQKVDKGHSCEV